MNLAANIETVKRAYAAFQARDLSALLDCLAEDVLWFSIAPSDRRWEETSSIRINGDPRDSTAREYEHSAPVEFIGEGSRVVAIGAATDSDGIIGSAVDSSSWVHVFTLRSGKITEFHAFYDVEDAVAALASMERQTQSVPARANSRSGKDIAMKHISQSTKGKDPRDRNPVTPPPQVGRGKETSINNGDTKKTGKPLRMVRSATAGQRK